LFDQHGSKEITTPRKPIDTPLFPFWVEDRGLSFFLGFLVLITIFVPMIRLSRPGRIGLDLIFAFMLFSGAVATIRHRALMYLVVVVTVFEFAADLIVEFDASLAVQAKLRSKHNTFMALTVVFIMLSNHYPVATYGNRYGWQVLVVLVVVGWIAAGVIRKA